MDIKLFDVSLENSLIQEEFFAEFKKLYEASDFTLGFKEGAVEQCEKNFREYCGRKWALGVSSGTAALHMVSFALGLKPGDEVVVPANTFMATALAPAMMGATVVSCDIDPDTLNVTKETVEKACSSKTKAIYAVNMYGNPAPYNDLRKLGIPLVEDAAHSHGAQYQGVPSGKLGDYSIFSFFPTKVFGGIGDSGLILSDKEETYELLRAFRNCGQEKSHYAVLMGNVYRMAVIQGLFLSIKWKIFNKIVSHRQKIAAIYDEIFKGSSVKPQKVGADSTSSYFAYVVRVANRDQLTQALTEFKIPWTIQYRYLLNQQPVWNKISHRDMPVPEAEKALQEIISLPMNLSVTPEQATFIAEKTVEIAKRG